MNTDDTVWKCAALNHSMRKHLIYCRLQSVAICMNAIQDRFTNVHVRKVSIGAFGKVEWTDFRQGARTWWVLTSRQKLNESKEFWVKGRGRSNCLCETEDELKLLLSLGNKSYFWLVQKGSQQQAQFPLWDQQSVCLSIPKNSHRGNLSRSHGVKVQLLQDLKKKKK